MNEKDVLDRLKAIDERIAGIETNLVEVLNQKDDVNEWLQKRLKNRDATIVLLANAIDKIYRHNEAARAAVVQHYGRTHAPIVTDLQLRAKESKKKNA